MLDIPSRSDFGGESVMIIWLEEKECKEGRKGTGRKEREEEEQKGHRERESKSDFVENEAHS